MYREAHYEGDRLHHDLVGYATLADSSRVEIKKDDFGMSSWLYWYNVVPPIRHGLVDRLLPVLRHYCAQTGNQVTRLVVETAASPSAATVRSRACRHRSSARPKLPVLRGAR